MTKILNQTDPILRKVAKPVLKKEFGSKELSSILKKMSLALLKQDDGVALAAPQIGVGKRIFIVSGRTLSRLAEGEEGDSSSISIPDIVFINPEIVKLSRKKKLLEEGCLSIRWLYGKVSRSEKVTVKAFDRMGHPFSLGASGLLAQIFQHETDHLDGILFIDKAKDLEEIKPESKSAKK